MRWPWRRPRPRGLPEFVGMVSLGPDLSTRGVRRLRGPDHYLSTYCYHDLHSDCRLTCKTCGKACLCECHEEGP